MGALSDNHVSTTGECSPHSIQSTHQEWSCVVTSIAHTITREHRSNCRTNAVARHEQRDDSGHAQWSTRGDTDMDNRYASRLTQSFTYQRCTCAATRWKCEDDERSVQNDVSSTRTSTVSGRLKDDITMHRAIVHHTAQTSHTSIAGS
jgi:hypothetical protein